MHVIASMECGTSNEGEGDPFSAMDKELAWPPPEKSRRQNRGSRPWTKNKAANLAITIAIFCAGWWLTDIFSPKTQTVYFHEEYGNCSVFEQIDPSADKVAYVLSCRQRELTDKTVISFVAFEPSGDFGVFLSKGFRFLPTDTTDIAIGVDQSELYTARWDYDSEDDYAQLMNDSLLFNALLREMSAGDRIAIRVGKEQGDIVISGANTAIADFSERVSHAELHANLIDFEVFGGTEDKERQERARLRPMFRAILMDTE